MTNIQILILDPDPARCSGLKSLVRDEGHEVIATESVSVALEWVYSDTPDLVLLAEELGAAGDGYEVAGRMTQAMAGRHCPVLMVSDLPATAERIDRALRAGCDRYLGRAEMGALASILKRALASRAKVEGIEHRRQALDIENRRLRAAAEPPNLAEVADRGRSDLGTSSMVGMAMAEGAPRAYRPEDWIGHSRAACELRSDLLRLAERGVSGSLIQGPMGTGKRLLARILHSMSRPSGAMEVLGCSGLSAAEFEQALFGSNYDGVGGLCQRAQHGTIQLESIENLPLRAQQRLREIMDSPVIPGSTIPIDVNWIVSTSTDLSELVKSGGFDRQLHARLRRDELVIPPLNARRDDLEELAHHYLSRFGVARGVSQIAPEAIAAMGAYPWPGNVAELADCIEQACLRADDGTVRVKDLTRSVRRIASESARAWTLEGEAHQIAPESRMDALGGQPMEAIVPTSESWATHPWDITDQDPIDLEHYEKKALIRALASCGGDKLATAKLLKVGKSTLYRKLKRFGISAERGSVHH